MNIALVGNQNCGKTTLFNRLTGSRQHTGNWPGVTVEKKTGSLQPVWRQGCHEAIQIVDLPGVYSLTTFSPEEQVTRRYLLEEPPDVIINVVDASHLERNLYLTLQLLQLQRPMVVALNMTDVLRLQGDQLDIPALEDGLAVSAVPVCARSGEGLSALMERACRAAGQKQPISAATFAQGRVEVALRALAGLVERMTVQHRRLLCSPQFAAVCLMEGDLRGCERLGLSTEHPLHEQAQALLLKLEAQTGLPPAAALASERYRYLERLVAGCLVRKAGIGQAAQADRLLLRSIAAVPTFLAIVALVFTLSFGWPGGWLAEALTTLLKQGTMQWGGSLQTLGLSPWLNSLLVEGLLPGLGSVLSFLPPLLVLMLLLCLLEDSGYLARAAFLMDRPLRCIGLSGRSLIPLMLGFGCTVPAVLSVRGIKCSRERRLTILLAPLMSCGAKVPVYILLASAFFPDRKGWVILCLYLTGILLAVLAGLAQRWGSGPSGSEPFLLELPDYRKPSLGNALREVWNKAREFLCRTFSVILLATLAVWLLQSYGPGFRPALSLEDSLLGRLAGWLAPLLEPCGFGSPAAVAALMTGLLAKESIVSTLAVLAGAEGLSGVFPSSLSAVAFLGFVLLYPPCAAAMTTIRRELNSRRQAALLAMGQLLLAWSASMLIYQLGSLLGWG